MICVVGVVVVCCDVDEFCGWYFGVCVCDWGEYCFLWGVVCVFC